MPRSAFSKGRHGLELKDVRGRGKTVEEGEGIEGTEKRNIDQVPESKKKKS